MSLIAFLIVYLLQNFLQSMETEKIIDANKQGHPTFNREDQGEYKKTIH